MTRFNSTRFIDDSSTFVVENHSSYVDGDNRAYQKVRSVAKADLYNDILDYVSANYNPHYVTLNIPAGSGTGPTIEWIDARTLKLDPGDIDGAVDHKVILTTDETVFDKVYTTDAEYHQKSYNEYVYPQAVYAEQLKAYSVFSDNPSLIPVPTNEVRVDTIYLKNQIVDLDQYSPVTTLDDALSIINDINIIESDFNLLKELFYSIYESRRFGDYDLQVKTPTDYNTVPGPGVAFILDQTDDQITKIRFSAYSFRDQYFRNLISTDDVDYSAANILNNYLINDHDDGVLRIFDYDTGGERQYNLDKGNSNADPAIEKIVDANNDNICYEFTVQLRTLNGTDDLRDISDETFGNTTVKPISFTMYRDTNGISDLLKGYMLKTGKQPNSSLQDEFTGEIKFKQGLSLDNSALAGSTIKLNGEVGEVGYALTSKGSETPEWTNLDNIYVKKAGDTMTGSLVMDSTTIDLFNSGITTRKTTDSVDDGQGNEIWNSNVDRFNAIRTQVPKLNLNDGSDKPDYSSPYGIKFNLDAGNTAKNQVRVSNRYGDIISIGSGPGPTITFGKPFEPDGDPNHPNANGDAWEGNGYFEGNEKGVKILGIPTPSADAPDSIAVNKGYVDNAIAESTVVESGCIELNGGHLCGGEPHPGYIETTKAGNLFSKNEWSSSYALTNGITEDGIVYATDYYETGYYKTIYTQNLHTGETESVGYFYDRSFNDSNNQEKYHPSCGALSHDHKYVLAGSKKGGYSSGGTVYNKEIVVYERDLSATGNSTNNNHTVDYQALESYYTQSVITTNEQPNAPHGYVISTHSLSGKYSGNWRYYNLTGISKIGSTDSPKKFYNYDLFGGSYSENIYAYAHEGNPKYGEYFLSATNKSTMIKKVVFGTSASSRPSDASFEDLVSAPDYIKSITYLPKSKRYYFGGNTYGYLSRPFDGPLDSTAFEGAIRVNFSTWKTPPNSNNSTYTLKRFNGLIRPFEFGGEIVLHSDKIYKYTDSKYFYAPLGIAIFEGNEWTNYESTIRNGQEDPDGWTGNDYLWEQVISVDNLKYTHQSKPQHYVGTSYILPGDAKIETPLFNQPYDQPLTWNGVDVSLVIDKEDQRYPGTFAVYAASYTLVRADQNSNLADGVAYTLRNEVLTYDNFNGAFLTLGWIKKYADLLPDDAEDVRLNNFSGSWRNLDAAAASREVTEKGTLRTINGIQGIVVNFSDDNTVSDTRRNFKITIPDAILAMVRSNELGMGPLE